MDARPASAARSAYDAALEILDIVRRSTWSEDVRAQIILIRAEAGFSGD